MVRFLRTVTYEIRARDYSDAEMVWDDDGPELADGVTVFDEGVIRVTADNGETLVYHKTLDGKTEGQPDVIIPRGRVNEWAIPMGGQVGLDTSSSASRQHRIDTGEYLREGEAEQA